MILLAANKLLEQTMHAFLIPWRQAVAVESLKVFFRQMLNVHVVVRVLRLPVLLLPVLSVHYLDPLRSFDLLVLADLLFGFFSDGVPEIKVGDFRQHKGRQVVGVFTVASAVLGIKTVGTADDTENFDVLR